MLEQGHNVIATSRKPQKLSDEMTAINPDLIHNLLALPMDVNDEENVHNTIQEGLARFGSIDTVINNAGYGQIGTVEELSDQEARQNFDANVFGMLNVIRHVVPHMRQSRKGHIMNISSMAGIQGYIPGWGIYGASKFAVAGLTEALYEELKEFGIRVTLVYPGHMRTNFLTSSSIRSPKNPIADYVAVRQGEEYAKTQMTGAQMGNPEKAATIIIQADQDPTAPMNLFLGQDVYEATNKVLARIQADLEAWKDKTLSINFEG